MLISAAARTVCSPPASVDDMAEADSLEDQVLALSATEWKLSSSVIPQGLPIFWPN
jgi:hypothetical protein